mgnify:FL=1
MSPALEAILNISSQKPIPDRAIEMASEFARHVEKEEEGMVSMLMETITNELMIKSMSKE